MSVTSGDRLPPPAGDPARADASPVEPAGCPGPAWRSLPKPVRSRLAEAASLAVGALPVDDVPIPLRRLARFTPAKRSRLGRPTLLAELEASGAFRAAVVAWWDEHRPGELAPTVDDPLAAAAAAVLLADPAAADAVALAARRGEAVELRAERDEALARVDKLTGELERLRAELADARAAVRTAVQERDAEYQQLRRRVSEQGARLRAALDGQVASQQAVEDLRVAAAADLAALAAERDRERKRAEAERRRAADAVAEVAAARQAAREARQSDEVRLGLLLDTVGGALAGLRRELALGGGVHARATWWRGPARFAAAAPSTPSSRSTRCSRCRRGT